MSKGKLCISHIVLIFASFLSVFPLYYMVCGATNQSIDVVRGKLFPGTYLVENFKDATEVFCIVLPFKFSGISNVQLNFTFPDFDSALYVLGKEFSVFEFASFCTVSALFSSEVAFFSHPELIITVPRIKHNSTFFTIADLLYPHTGIG